MPHTTRDEPDGKDFRRFGGLHYRHARRLDGVPSTGGMLVTERTKRLFFGPPEIYITAVYRWHDRSVVDFLSGNADEFGSRMGRNKLLLPYAGSEEQFWNDVQFLLTKVQEKTGESVEIRDDSVYLLISGINPQLLASPGAPFLSLDISQLNGKELTALFSKFLDLFNVDVRFGTGRDPTSAGKLFLSGVSLPDNTTGAIARCANLLAEVSLVIDTLDLKFYSFPWPVTAEFNRIVEDLSAGIEVRNRLARIRASLRGTELPEKSTATVDHPQLQQADVDSRDVFLCHRSVDKELVRTLGKALADLGLSVWLDEAMIRWGDSIASKLAEGIQKARFVIVCVGSSFRSGNFAKYELELAMHDEVRFGRSKVLPLLLTDSPAESEELLSQVPTVRSKSYRTLESGISNIAKEVAAMCQS